MLTSGPPTVLMDDTEAWPPTCPSCRHPMEETPVEMLCSSCGMVRDLPPSAEPPLVLKPDGRWTRLVDVTGTARNFKSRFDGRGKSIPTDARTRFLKLDRADLHRNRAEKNRSHRATLRIAGHDIASIVARLGMPAGLASDAMLVSRKAPAGLLLGRKSMDIEAAAIYVAAHMEPWCMAPDMKEIAAEMYAIVDGCKVPSADPVQALRIVKLLRRSLRIFEPRVSVLSHLLWCHGRLRLKPEELDVAKRILSIPGLDIEGELGISPRGIIGAVVYIVTTRRGTPEQVKPREPHLTLDEVALATGTTNVTFRTAWKAIDKNRPVGDEVRAIMLRRSRGTTTL